MPPYEKSVFINCPFDEAYLPFFDRIIFTVIDCGFAARSALEVSNSAESRIDRIVSIIRESKYSIHDLSRTGLDKDTRLPRFNMPFELGVCVGAKRFGDNEQQGKDILILDSKKFRYQKYISDLNGYDPKYHQNKKGKVFGVVRSWLAGKSASALPHGTTISKRYTTFRRALPKICDRFGWTVDEMQFFDKTHAVQFWLEQVAT